MVHNEILLVIGLDEICHHFVTSKRNALLIAA